MALGLVVGEEDALAAFDAQQVDVPADLVCFGNLAWLDAQLSEQLLSAAKYGHERVVGLARWVWLGAAVRLPGTFKPQAPLPLPRRSAEPWFGWLRFSLLTCRKGPSAVEPLQQPSSVAQRAQLVSVSS